MSRYQPSLQKSQSLGASGCHMHCDECQVPAESQRKAYFQPRDACSHPRNKTVSRRLGFSRTVGRRSVCRTDSHRFRILGFQKGQDTGYCGLLHLFIYVLSFIQNILLRIFLLSLSASDFKRISHSVHLFYDH